MDVANLHENPQLGFFLKDLFYEYCNDFALEEAFVVRADEALQSTLLKKRVDPKVFKECLSWHMKNNPSFFDIIFSDSKFQDKPYWGIIYQWNKLIYMWRKEGGGLKRDRLRGLEDQPYRSVSMVDMDDLKKGKLTVERALELLPHAKKMIKTSRNKEMYQAVIDTATGVKSSFFDEEPPSGGVPVVDVATANQKTASKDQSP